MQKTNQPIKISGFEKGIATSPYKGFVKIVGLDIYKKPGIVQLGAKLINTGLTLTGRPTASCIDPYGNKYIGTSDGYVYKNGTAIASSRGIIHDIVYVGDYILISTGGAYIDAYGPVSVGPTYLSAQFTATNFTASSYGWKKMFVGQDNVVYIGNENRLATITNIFTSVTAAGTGPAVNAIGSWILNASCFSTGLPTGRIIQTLCEYNRYVCIVTSAGSGVSGNTRIYFMDRGTLDPSKTAFSLSIGIDIPEQRVWQIINQNNRLIFFGNDTGTIYTTNTVTYTPVAMLPNRIVSQSYNILQCPNAISIVENEILFGVGGGTNSAFDTVYGVYSLKGTSLICKNIVSSGEYGQGADVFIGTITGNGSNYRVGWKTGTTYGVDETSFNLNSNFNAWIESPMYDVGEPEQKATYQKIKIELGRNFEAPTTSGNQRIRLSYRGATDEDYTVITPTISSADYLGKNAIHIPAKITGLVGLQVKIEFDVGTENYGQNIELRSVTFE